MPDLPDYAVKNREAWTAFSVEFAEPGRRAWARSEIAWGVWEVPEATARGFEGVQLAGKDVIELGCGTAYFSAWMARAGARPVGIDVTPAQLANARLYQDEFGLRFPLLEGNAEAVPYPDASFDVAISEYGASIWCDPDRWIAEAARLLRPGGWLVFLRNSTIQTLCAPNAGDASDRLVRDWFGLRRLDWDDDGSVEFHAPTGEMVRILRSNGFELDALIELRAPPEAAGTKFYIPADWAKRWPCEEIWRARKK